MTDRIRIAADYFGLLLGRAQHAEDARVQTRLIVEALRMTDALLDAEWRTRPQTPRFPRRSVEGLRRILASTRTARAPLLKRRVAAALADLEALSGDRP